MANVVLTGVATSHEFLSRDLKHTGCFHADSWTKAKLLWRVILNRWELHHQIYENLTDHLWLWLVTYPELWTSTPVWPMFFKNTWPRRGQSNTMSDIMVKVIFLLSALCPNTETQTPVAIVLGPQSSQ